MKKKSRKVSDKAEILEGIQEKEGQDNPDPTILEEEEKMEEGSKLPWRQAGDEEGTLAMAPSEIARYFWQLMKVTFTFFLEMKIFGNICAPMTLGKGPINYMQFCVSCTLPCTRLPFS